MMDNFGQQQQSQFRPPTTPIPMPGSKPKGIGCNLTGCLIGCLVMFVLFVAAVGGTGYYVYHVVTTYILQDEGIEVEAVTLDDEEIAALAQKLAPVREAFKNDTGDIVELSLTADEVSYILLHGSEMQENPTASEGGFNVSFPGPDKIIIKASFPVTMETEIKYVSFEGAGEIKVNNGTVKAKIEKLALGGDPKKEMSGALLDAFNRDLSVQLQQSPDLKYLWERVRDLKIEDGMIHLKLRALKMPENHGSDMESGGNQVE